MTDPQTVLTNPAASAPPSSLSAGAQLQLAREEAGLTLDAVAQQLKLAPRQVKAIEEDDFAGLPGRTFVRGFVRNYARLLRLDAETVLAGLPGGSTPSIDPPTLHATAQTIGELPTSERRSLSWTRWAIPLTLVVIVGAAVYEFRSHGDEFSSSKDNARRGLPPRGDTTGPAGAVPGTSQKQGVNGVPGSASPPTAETAAEPSFPKPATTASSQDGGSITPSQGSGGGPGETTLVLTLHDSSWIEVKDRSGQVLMAQLVAAGQTQSLSGAPPFELVLGNAPQVSLTYRGEPVDLAPYTRANVARLTLQ